MEKILNDQDVYEICELVQSAGKEVLKIRSSEQAASLKSDLSPVTLADLRSNEIIKQGLTARFPETQIVSEEGAKFGYDAFWLVDPLDGTKEFMTGKSEFTVNIAFIVAKAVEFGAVYAPATGELFFGGKKYGSWKQVAEGVAPIRVNQNNNFPVRIAVSRSHIDFETLEFADRYPRRELISSGSSLKLCLVSDGRADLYPRFGRTMEWDIAAGQAVLEGAGGGVFSFPELQSLGYEKPNWENPAFIAAASRRLIKLDPML